MNAQSIMVVVFAALLALASRTLSAQQAPATSRPAGEMAATELFAKASPAVVRIVCGDASGSGFFVSAKGLVVTNYHVIEGATAISVVLPNNAKFAVKKVLVRDRVADLAVLDTGADDVPFLMLATKTPETGERVYAIGNPQGLKNTLSEGLVSGIREDKGVNYIQTTAAISPGSSGGPLLLNTGQVVGVTTFTYLRSQNLNFAVQWPHVKKVIEQSATTQPTSIASSQPGQPNPVQAVKDYESYSDRTRKFLTRLQRLDSDIEVGISYRDFHEAVADLNFATRQWRESLSDEEKKLYSARCIEFAVAQFKGADEYWRKAMLADYSSVEALCKRVQQEAWAYARDSVALAEKALKTQENLQFPIACKVCDATGMRTCVGCGGSGKLERRTKCELCLGKGKTECLVCSKGQVDLSKDKKNEPIESTARSDGGKGITDEERRKLQEEIRQARTTVDDLAAQLQKCEADSAKIVEYVKLQADISMYESYPQFADKVKAARDRLNAIGSVLPGDVDAYKKKREGIVQALEEARKNLRKMGGG